MNWINKTKFCYVFIIVFALYSCNNKSSDPTPVATGDVSTATRILPLGASRVEGARPSFESYRYELWKLLVSNNKSFDFIGSATDNASYPAFNNKNFDTDHEGRSGATSGEVLTELTGSIGQIIAKSGTPDIVLFSSPGGNDGLQNLSFDQAVQNVNATIDLLQKNNPNVTIIIEKMAPPHSSASATIAAYLSRMNTEVSKIATAKTTTTSKVMTVDMFTGFTDAMLADQVHYNETGAGFIANRYYEVLKSIVK